MEQIKKQITDLLWKYTTKAHGAGSCGELGDSFMAIDADYISDIADEILQNFELKNVCRKVSTQRKNTKNT